MAEIKSKGCQHFKAKIALSKRELDCAKLLLSGLTSKEIGSHLNLSYRTIEDYISSLKRKFNARNKSDLIVKLLDYGVKV
jgi:DNA-binding CsgD family transcriptional regulator